MRSRAAASHQRVDSPIMLSACVPVPLSGAVRLCPGAAVPVLPRCCPGAVRLCPVPLSRLSPGAAVPVLFALDPVPVLLASGQAARPREAAAAASRHTAARSSARLSLTTARLSRERKNHRTIHTPARSRPGRGPRQNFRRRREVDSGIR